MPDWTAPFKLPHMKTEEFLKMKADYVAKHGYSYSFPGIAETLNYPFINPMTPQEDADWKAKRFKNFSDMRYEELKFLKKKRKERFQEMLSSPTPNLLQSRASIITALDNTQDAMSTGVTVAKLAARVLPKLAVRALSGPLGWIMGTADLINLSRAVLSPELMPLERKRSIDVMTGKNPYSRKARIKNRQRFIKGKIGKGALIEAAQTSKDIFGYGLTLGPIFAFPYDALFGAVRTLQGKPSQVKMPIPDWDYWKIVGKKALKALTAKWTVPFLTDIKDMFEDLVLFNAASQIESSAIDDFDTMEGFDDIGNTLVRAPSPQNVITREVISEEGFNPDEGIAWPSTGKEWSTINEILDSGLDIVNDNFNRFAEATKNDIMGYHAAQNAGDGAFYSMENLAGPGEIEYDYTVPAKSMYALHNLGYELPGDMTKTQILLLASWLDDREAIGQAPSAPMIVLYLHDYLGVTVTRPPPIDFFTQEDIEEWEIRIGKLPSYHPIPTEIIRFLSDEGYELGPYSRLANRTNFSDWISSYEPPGEMPSLDEMLLFAEEEPYLSFVPIPLAQQTLP